MASRCMFFGEWKKPFGSKFMHLELLLIRHKKKLYSLRFSLHEFLHLKFLDPIQNRALSRYVQLQDVYLEALL